ncbi:MAG: hypothetical protein JJU21_05625 [Salinarimonas sp.]|nr:hypothetical protein [Salinarimonas sp.]
MKNVLLLAIVAIGLSACQTTQEVAQEMRGVWIGQPVDSFFVMHGPPVSEYALAGGGKIYTWRGGEDSYTRPAQIRSTTMGGQRIGSSTTRSRTTHPSAGTTVTRSTTTSASFGLPAITQDVVVRPAERVELLCEAQLSVDAQGIIEQVRISRDTEGRGFSLSRCAEVFGS